MPGNDCLFQRFDNEWIKFDGCSSGNRACESDQPGHNGAQGEIVHVACVGNPLIPLPLNGVFPLASNIPKANRAALLVRLPGKTKPLVFRQTDLDFTPDEENRLDEIREFESADLGTGKLMMILKSSLNNTDNDSQTISGFVTVHQFPIAVDGPN